MGEFDVIVVGGGSAGTAAAAAASRAGARTLMINDGELGGLCILRGCMPTKALLASAHRLHHASHGELFGVRLAGRVLADFPGIMARKQAQVRRFQRAKIASVEAESYEVLHGRARFVRGGDVEVDGRRLVARAYVIATGSTPVRLPLPGLDEVPVITSDEALQLSEQPRSLLVQGAGPIGLELAQFFARIGTRVLLVNRSPLLARHDPECGQELARALDAEAGLQLAVPGAVQRLRPGAHGLEATVRCGPNELQFAADAVLLATGRCAALDGLGLKHLGLAAPDGRLRHDAHMRTTNPDVYVAGDATGRVQILHVANQEGTVAGHNAAHGRPEKLMGYRLKLTAIFTDPPFAAVGLGEAEAARRGIDYVVGRARLPETGRAITMGAEHGLWKLLARGDTGEILGSALVGPRADDLIHLVAAMMHYRGSADEICALPWYHPTLAEVMLNLGRDVARQRHRGVDAPGGATLPPGYLDQAGEGREVR